MVTQQKITKFINALKSKFESKSNKTNDITGNFNNDKDSYLTAQATVGALDGKVDKILGKGLSQEDFTSAEKTKLSGIAAGATNVTVDHSLSSSSTNAIDNKSVTDALALKMDNITLADVATSGSYNDLTNKPTIPTIPTIEVIKQQTAETGYAATYQVQIDGVQSGVAINIPKDFLIKSGTVNTVGATGAQTASALGAGYSNGDKYLDFVINTKDNDGTDEHIYINVKDLVEDTTYTADNTTLQLDNNGQFSVKNGGISSTQLASDINTSLGYADDYHDSPASSITYADVTAWNSKTNTSDVDSQIDAALDLLASTLDGS